MELITSGIGATAIEQQQQEHSSISPEQENNLETTYVLEESEEEKDEGTKSLLSSLSGDMVTETSQSYLKDQAEPKTKVPKDNDSDEVAELNEEIGNSYNNKEEVEEDDEEVEEGDEIEETSVDYETDGVAYSDEEEDEAVHQTTTEDGDDDKTDEDDSEAEYKATEDNLAESKQETEKLASETEENVILPLAVSAATAVGEMLQHEPLSTVKATTSESPAQPQTEQFAPQAKLNEFTQPPKQEVVATQETATGQAAAAKTVPPVCSLKSVATSMTGVKYVSPQKTYTIQKPVVGPLGTLPTGLQFKVISSTTIASSQNTNRGGTQQLKFADINNNLTNASNTETPGDTIIDDNVSHDEKTFQEVEKEEVKVPETEDTTTTTTTPAVQSAAYTGISRVVSKAASYMLQLGLPFRTVEQHGAKDTDVAAAYDPKGDDNDENKGVTSAQEDSVSEYIPPAVLGVVDDDFMEPVKPNVGLEFELEQKRRNRLQLGKARKCGCGF